MSNISNNIWFSGNRDRKGWSRQVTRRWFRGCGCGGHGGWIEHYHNEYGKEKKTWIRCPKCRGKRSETK